MQCIHPEWQEIIRAGLSAMDQNYLLDLQKKSDWLPGENAIFNAFRQPLSKTEYLLLGESPYPRAESANGYAFWDAKVHELWSEKGLSKAVNRATSLRNLMKMLLFARGNLSDDFSQLAISKVDKSSLVHTIDDLFQNMINSGFLLLNASLVLSQERVSYDAKHWKIFIDCVLHQLSELKPSIKLVLFGKIANQIEHKKQFNCLIAEHPYNISFITNKKILEFFKPLSLLAPSPVTI